MMMNENQNLSRKENEQKKRRVIMDGRMKTLLNRQAEKNKDSDTIKNSERQLVKIKYADKPDKLSNALKELKERDFNDMNTNEIKNEVLKDYKDVFGMAGSMVILLVKIFEKLLSVLEVLKIMNYIDTIDEGYKADDSIFTR